MPPVSAFRFPNFWFPRSPRSAQFLLSTFRFLLSPSTLPPVHNPSAICHPPLATCHLPLPINHCLTAFGPRLLAIGYWLLIPVPLSADARAARPPAIPPPSTQSATAARPSGRCHRGISPILPIAPKSPIPFRPPGHRVPKSDPSAPSTPSVAPALRPISAFCFPLSPLPLPPSAIRRQPPAIGHWPSATGHCLSAIGYRLLAIGYWLLILVPPWVTPPQIVLPLSHPMAEGQGEGPNNTSARSPSVPSLPPSAQPANSFPPPGHRDAKSDSSAPSSVTALRPTHPASSCPPQYSQTARARPPNLP